MDGLAALLQVAAAGGAFWLAYAIVRPQQNGVALGVAAAVTAWYAAQGLAWAAARKSVADKTREAARVHMASLLRRRAQLVQNDAYGRPQRAKWDKEIGYFIAHHVVPRLSVGERDVLDGRMGKMAGLIDHAVDAAWRHAPADVAFAGEMTPAGFEAACAQVLRGQGWDARVTSQSRDQGVDVIAERAGLRVVIQCKWYARPVGNKSVQEIAAARAHERADYGVVVTNNRYTPAAEQLAATNRVLLLHHRDLAYLETLLPQRKK